MSSVRRRAVRATALAGAILLAAACGEAGSTETATAPPVEPDAAVLDALTGSLATGLQAAGSVAPIDDPTAGLGPLTDAEAQLAVGITATTAVSLPTPAPAPTQAYFDEPIVDLGRLVIPTMGIDRTLHQGISLHNIDRGPSHWPGTALPGELGNVVIAGHRTTHGAPFRDLDALVPGDDLFFEVDGEVHRYVVVGDEVVTPHGLHIVDQTPEHRATLFACHPPGSAEYRYVVHLELDPTSDLTSDELDALVAG